MAEHNVLGGLSGLGVPNVLVVVASCRRGFVIDRAVE
jgi:hypothetical protein